MQSERLKQKLNQLPTQPGCYIWKDKAGGVLYVGKAVNLKNRVNSYFNNYARLDPKIKLMVDLIVDIDTYTVDSEIEALILETNLIKKYRPKYNKLMKDDKNYSYLLIDWNNPYPSVKIVREKDQPKAEYYGPYPSRFPIFKVLRRLRKVYPYCEHLSNKLQINPAERDKLKITKPCFDYHIGLCSGVCANLITKEEHRKNITGIRRFFQGKKVDMIEDLKKDMEVYSKNRNFEKAAHVRDRVKDLEYVTQRIRIDKDMDEHKLEQMKVELSKRALTELIDKLDLKLDSTRTNFKIECFDISNIQGTNAVASMVVSVEGKPAKNLYRKFKIKTKQTPDDFEMMREVLSRRLGRLDNLIPQSGTNLKLNSDSNNDQPLTHIAQPNSHVPRPTSQMDESFNVIPDLIIVDGGKGQLSAAYGVLKKFGLVKTIPLIGLAKREEEIFIVRGEDLVNNLDFRKVILPRRSEALYLIQRIRDEAHRFAITFHRKLRGKASTKSVLDDIKGVGKIIKKKLIDAFGSMEGIKKASETELLTVIRNKSTVKNIKKQI